MKTNEGVPHLVLVPADQVMFHEHPERKRTLRLADRLREEGRLRNPPVVAKLDSHRWVLLDGANRVSAMKEMGLSHVPVQVIDYASSAIELSGWHHLLLESQDLDLRGEFTNLPNVHVQPLTPGERAEYLELRRGYAVLHDANGRSYGISPFEGRVELMTWIQTLDQIVAAYEGKTRLERVKVADYENLPEAIRDVSHQLLLYPVISKVELLGLVRERMPIPTGLTRHLIPGRALGLNLDLAFLTELNTEDEKREHFRSFVDSLEMAGRIRYYEESVFILNE